MSRDSSVYDLGDLDSRSMPQAGGPAGGARASAPAGSDAPNVRPASARLPFRRFATFEEPRAWRASLSLLVPGAGQMASGSVAPGLAFLTGMGFLAALAWAIRETLSRLTPTLDVLGLPPECGTWALGGLLVAGAFLHVAGVVAGASPTPGRVPPALAACASLALPGWGQILNGHRVRAALFLAGLWLSAATWILDSAWLGDLLVANGLELPRVLALAATPAVRWTLPVIVWAIAVYDAALGAVNRWR